MEAGSRLTPKQKQFCHEYLIDFNGTQAATRAGYSPTSAHDIAYENLKKPEIQEHIQRLMDYRSHRTDITADFVLSTIAETVDRCRQAAPVLDRKGRPVLVDTPQGELRPAFVFDSGGVLKGCELLGKNLKLFTDKHEVEGKITVQTLEKIQQQKLLQAIPAEVIDEIIGEAESKKEEEK